MTLTHFDESGQAHMVDIAQKNVTQREARAQGRIVMSQEAFAACLDKRAHKGDVLAVARIAAIMAAKRTSDLIPLCHPLSLTKVSVEFSSNEAARSVTVQTTVRTEGKTGVEMEALTAASVGLLTVYDMLKAIDKGMRIEGVALLEKSGGKSGHYLAQDSEKLVENHQEPVDKINQ